MYRFAIVFFIAILTPVTISAEQAYLDDRKFYLHENIDETGDFTWGNFLSCLKTVKFPGDDGPRKLDRKISRLVITEINNHSWIFSVREDDSKVELESVTIDTHKYYTLKEKRRLFLKIVSNCQLENK